MTPFVSLNGLVAPVDQANIDTDAILPKQFMKSISRTGFGPNLFDEHRYLDRGEPGQDLAKRVVNPEFSLNQARYSGATILLTRQNFGCGSSREHAPWALIDYGFRAIIAPSFADIFYGNCFKNGLLPVVLPSAVVDALFEAVYRTPDYRLTVDLLSQTVADSLGETWRFEVDSTRKESLLKGLDDIAITLSKAAKIRSYEALRKKQEPWLFEKGPSGA